MITFLIRRLGVTAAECLTWQVAVEKEWGYGKKVEAADTGWIFKILFLIFVCILSFEEIQVYLKIQRKKPQPYPPQHPTLTKKKKKKKAGRNDYGGKKV